MTTTTLCTVCASGRPPLFPDAVVYLFDPQQQQPVNSSTSGASSGTSGGGSVLAYSCQQLQALLDARNITSQNATTCQSVQRVARSPCGCVSCTNVYQDTCPLQTDNRCGNYDPLLDPSQLCLDTHVNDCIDCDPYRDAFRNCVDCTNAKGAWCPLDALCAFEPLPNWLPGFVKYGSCDQDAWYTKPDQCNQTVTVVSTEGTGNDDGDEDPLEYQDPLVAANLWAYDMIRVNTVWQQNITGRNIRIRINDDGVDAYHPEFRFKFDWDASCEQSLAYLPTSTSNVTATSRASDYRNESNSTNGTSLPFVAPQQGIRDTHGTSCASIAAGTGNNSMCAVGIAPEATLSSCKILTDDGLPVANYPQALSKFVDRYDISSNSFGYSGCHATATSTGRRRRHRRRGLQSNHSDDDGSDACPFLPNSIPCQECAGFADKLSDACTAAIAQYCSNSINYDADPACVTYLELFATCEFNSLTEAEQQELARGIRLGRNGKGIVYVFPSGNDRNYGNYAGYTAFGNTRFVISVGAVNRRGYPASYSAPGPGVFVSAPGGDIDSRSNWITALAGAVGPDACHDAGYGTSFATPVVAGVLALVLEVNPSLRWRDVQGILAATSRKVEPWIEDGGGWDNRTNRSDDWAVNAAGLWHSYRYGFGLIDAEAAVDRARQWRNYGPERFVTVDSIRNLSIPILDASTSTISSSMAVHANLTVESVVVYLSLVDSSRGHLRIALVSPSGTESVLTPGERPENQQTGNERWKLMTVRAWGEGSIGNWTLFITDTTLGDVSDCADLPRTFSVSNTDDEVTCVDVKESPDVEEYCRDTDIAVACCSCGGGQNSTAVMNALHSWTLMLYGHDPTELGPSPSSTSSASTALFHSTTLICLVASLILFYR